MSHEINDRLPVRTRLKALLQEKHLQEHRAFTREYDRVASLIDRSMVGQGPSKATFYRWLSGDLQKLPYPSHCRVLEKMLPGWTANELFEPWDGAGRGSGSSSPPADAQVSRLAGLTSVFTTRSEFAMEVPPHSLFDDAMSADVMGLSLNFLCQQYPDKRLRELLRRARVRLLFLDPEGEAIKQRGQEEHHEEGHLEHWTRANINVARRIRDGLPADAAGRVELRTYDETVRFNVMLVDRRIGVLQPYLPASRGVDSPTFVMERKDPDNDLFSVAEAVFESTWKRGKRLD